ncbi:MAG: phage major capsid protein [Bacteroidales bacterium]|nr:phage major capsid protein [Candidatus Scybalousia scybalohippi]
MNIEEMNFEQVELRISEIRNSIESADVETLESMNSELDKLEERKKALKDEAIAHAEEARKIAEGEIGETIKTFDDLEGRTMVDIKEFRNSEVYVNAYAEYIKTGKDEELRALLTTNVGSGTIAVPDFVYEEIKTAWDSEDIMALVKKVNLKGNLKIQFEIAGTEAVFHTEGTGAIDEEVLTMGIVTLVPSFAKKFISISDEVVSLAGEAFLRYIYSEIAYKIAKLLADTLVAQIAALPQSATATSPSAAKIALAPALGTVATAVANLSDEASQPVIIMNKLTWAAFKEAQYAGNYGVDIFEGLAVKFNNSLPAYGTADAGAVYMIVGDLGQGAIANFPNGDDVDFKFDDITLATSDLVRVIGKEYVALGVVADKAFTLVSKPTSVG